MDEVTYEQKISNASIARSCLEQLGEISTVGTIPYRLKERILCMVDAEILNEVEVRRQLDLFFTKIHEADNIITGLVNTFEGVEDCIKDSYRSGVDLQEE